MLQFLQTVCQKLDSENIMYMVSGSLALNAYTVPRMTRDIDIVISLLPDQGIDFCLFFLRRRAILISTTFRLLF